MLDLSGFEDEPADDGDDCWPQSVCDDGDEFWRGLKGWRNDELGAHAFLARLAARRAERRALYEQWKRDRPDIGNDKWDL